MTTFTSPRTAKFWTRCLTGAASSWNGDTAAYPNGPGGVSFADTVDIALAVSTGGLYLTCQGSGDGGIVMNFGQNPFVGPVPEGYFAGWPALAGGPDQFSMATAQGTANTTDGTTVSFITGAGLIQSATAWRFGKFYVEYQATHDLFSVFCGAGVGRLGVDLNYWISGAQFGPGDANGGVTVNGGSIGDGYAAALTVQGVTAVPRGSLFSTPALETIALAIDISPQVAFRPASYSPVNLPRGYCCPVTLDPRWNKYLM